MYFDADKTMGAIGAVIPEKSAHSTGPGQQHNLNSQQFPGKGAGPAEGAGDAAGAEGAAAGGAEAGAAAGGASAAELAPLLLL